MSAFDATYFDGRTSARHAVRVEAWGGELRVLGEGVEERFKVAEVEADAPIAGAPRTLLLPGGARLQTDDHAAVEQLFARHDKLEAFVHKLERRWQYALAALLVVGAFAWWAIAQGLPLAAERIAALVPPQAEAAMGRHALAAIDGRVCGPSRLARGTQEQLQRDFARIVEGLEPGPTYRLELRHCPQIGPNALAFPGGSIVLTDQLVGLSRSTDELIGVLAHEVGHVRMRHGLRTLLQGAGLAALITALAGDAAALTSLAVTLPTVLLQSGYSRDFEDQADLFALERLKAIGGSARAFAEILGRLERETGRQAAGKSSTDYFSTHPVTAARVARALAAQTPADRARGHVQAGIEMMRNGQQTQAIDEFDRAIALDPKSSEAWVYRSFVWYALRDEARSLSDLERALAIGTRNAEAYNSAAWILSTSVDDSRRDGRRSLELARQAVEFSEWKEPNFIDTLAAAYAETGDFPEAARWQEKALEFPRFAQQHGFEGRARLELYRSGRPYREALK